METELKAISAIDGRYKYKTKELTDFFSEYALFRYRIQVEIEYFIFLSQLKLTHLKSFKSSDYKYLRNISKCYFIILRTFCEKHLKTCYDIVTTYWLDVRSLS